MTNDDQIRDEKLQYDINRAKISALSSSKINKYEYLAGEEILPSYQIRIIEQTKFTNSSLGKAFETQIEEQGEKQIKTLKEHGKQLAKSDENNQLLFSKEKKYLKRFTPKELQKQKG